MAEFDEPRMQEIQDDSEEFELGHTDKLVGVFTSPTETFKKIGGFPPKVVDWFLPMFVVILVAVFAGFVKMSNPAINYEVTQKQMEIQQKALDEQVQNGTITREQADQQLEASQTIMNSPVMKVIAVIGGLIAGFIMFFIMAGIYHLFCRFALKGDGTYGYALVGYGLANYVLILQHIIATILSLVTSKMINDISIASILGMNRTEPLGFVLSFIDPISIWFYIILGIGYAKLYKSDNTKKFIITVFAIWIGISLLFFVLSNYIPFLKNYSGM